VIGNKISVGLWNFDILYLQFVETWKDAQDGRV
jgi:hypothetical protein